MTPEQRDYLRARRLSHEAGLKRAALPPGSSRARVTSANARWGRLAAERNRLAALLTPEQVAEADAAEPLSRG